MEWKHETEESSMRCHVCGSEMQKTSSDLPFKLGARRILIIKNLPVVQCTSCNEYLIEDRIMQAVDTMIDDIDQAAELEVRQYVA